MNANETRQSALEALPAELQEDVSLVLLVTQALQVSNDTAGHQLAAAALLSAYRARAAADA